MTQYGSMHLPDIFTSAESLRSAFERGLQRQLNEESLGTFILVLANALFDDEIFSRLKEPLQLKFETLSQDYTNRLRHGKPLQHAADDILVFLKLIAMGFSSLRTTEVRTTEDWELQFNQLRSLRPKRMSGEKVSSLKQEFSDSGFHFNKPFLDKEIFWSGEIAGMAVKLLYNKFPFATLHGLLVPEPAENLPQFLHADMHTFISQLCNAVGDSIADFAIAFNGYGAGASINHLHFQTFVRRQPLPILNKKWQHNGGDEAYPVTCRHFDDSAEAWQYIDRLHRQNITYDLLYLPQAIYCLPRKFQGCFEIPQWTENFAWYELCGGITTFNKEDFLKLDNSAISNALRLLKI